MREWVAVSKLRSDHMVGAFNETRQVVLAHTIRLALSPGARLRGLIGSALDSGQGLLLRPCGSIHTCFMGYAIDVLFIDAEGQVVALEQSMRPWRFTSVHPGALATLELPSGIIAATSSALEDHIVFGRRHGGEPSSGGCDAR